MTPPTPPSMSLPVPAARQNADPAELGRFDSVASRWWDPEGEMRPLHDLNPVRLQYVERAGPLDGLDVVDVGCGGGLLAEAMARLAETDVLEPAANKPPGHGPARYFRLRRSGALVGFIGAVTCADFCATCNKLRLTANGKAYTQPLSLRLHRGTLVFAHALGGSLADKEIAVLGIAFKPNTDDLREPPALEVIHLLENEGAKIKAYDPQAMENARPALPKVALCKTPYEVADGVDALVLAVEWNEFKQLDLQRVFSLMHNPLILDGRNIWDSEKMRSIGFKYYSVGRPSNGNND